MKPKLSSTINVPAGSCQLCGAQIYANMAHQCITTARQASQPSHASGEPTQQAHQLALDTIDRLQDERDSAFQRGQQAMTEKAAQLLLRIRNQMTDIVERERYNNIANQILDLPDAVEPPQNKLAALMAKWRKIAAECPSKYRNKWRDVFEAVETCADELERSLAGAEPYHEFDRSFDSVEPPQDKLREAISELHGRARKEAQRFIRSKTLYPEYHAAEVAYETVLRLIDAESNRLEAREPGASER